MKPWDEMGWDGGYTRGVNDILYLSTYLQCGGTWTTGENRLDIHTGPDNANAPNPSITGLPCLCTCTEQSMTSVLINIYNMEYTNCSCIYLFGGE